MNGSSPSPSGLRRSRVFVINNFPVFRDGLLLPGPNHYTTLRCPRQLYYTHTGWVSDPRYSRCLLQSPQLLFGAQRQYTIFFFSTLFDFVRFSTILRKQLGTCRSGQFRLGQFSQNYAFCVEIDIRMRMLYLKTRIHVSNVKTPRSARRKNIQSSFGRVT